jgi:hypothetical protein
LDGGGHENRKGVECARPKRSADPRAKAERLD